MNKNRVAVHIVQVTMYFFSLYLFSQVIHKYDWILGGQTLIENDQEGITGEPMGVLTVPLKTRSHYCQMRVFVVVYKKHLLARQLVAQLLGSDLVSLSFEITVISNWGHFSFPDVSPFATFNSSLSVIHNTIRSPRSWGHLAREWNAALMHGFGNLEKPQSDVVVLIHGDASLTGGQWAQELYAEHGGAEGGGTLFLQSGRGDIFTSITAEGVRTIGIWDEHFVDVGAQEADYFLRAVRFGFDRVRIGDFGHSRLHRPWHRGVVGVDWVGDRHHFPAPGVPEYNFHKWSMEYWERKWPGINQGNWGESTAWIKGIKANFTTHYTYPYFERAIYNRKDLGYEYDEPRFPPLEKVLSPPE